LAILWLLIPKICFVWLFRALTRGESVALCLHRVCRTRPHVSCGNDLTIEESKLDQLIEYLIAARPEFCTAGPTCPKLFVTFDDGYADAFEYVASRSQKYAGVQWRLFICPTKTTQRVGFRWDLFEWEQLHKKSKAKSESETARLGTYMNAPINPSLENSRSELIELAQQAEFQLATPEQCRSAWALPNTALGNHTNLHHKLTALAPQVAKTELESSQAEFEASFGNGNARKDLEFAFPFGTPHAEFDQSHVNTLRTMGLKTIWTTECDTFLPKEMRPGAVLPRFPIWGTWSLKRTIVSLCYVSLRGKILRVVRPRAPW
jgi:hypothetical protein